MRKKDPSSICNTELFTKKEVDYKHRMNDYFEGSIGTPLEKIQNFTKYIPRQDLTRFLCKYELFKKVLKIQGSVFECGVYLGGGLMSFAQISSILEPTNLQRKIIGFDTFAGFAQVTKNDNNKTKNPYNGDMAIDSYDDIKTSILLYDQNRSIGHIEKVEIIKGDIVNTIPEYLNKNKNTLVSLLYLDLDIYKPTYDTIKNVLPRMPHGAIIAFDELNSPSWPGETLALLECLDINKYKIERFIFGSYISYIIL